MDDIQAVNVNCITTECGHQFHASCLLKNAAHNGFACPYCRTTLAEEPEDDDEDDEDDEDDVSQVSEQEIDLYSDYSLRGMRWLFQQAQEEPLDEEEDVNEEEEEAVEEQVPIPSAAYMTQKLQSQGITMEDLVKCMLYVNHEEYEDYESFQVKENELFGKFRILISNYNPVEDAIVRRVNAQNATNEAPPVVADNEAQPKIPNRRETMTELVDDLVRIIV
jgi:hypothetical protein